MNPQKVLAIAKRQIGYKEAPANSNNTKFGSWYGMNYQPWCAMFVSYCFYVAGLPLAATTSKGFAYCPYGVNWFKKLGRWFKTPKVGDVVFFSWKRNGLAQHVGIVSEVLGNGCVRTIEGNTSGSDNANGGMVMARVRKPSEILGYGRPQYSDRPEVSTNADHPSWNGRFIQLTTPYTEGEDVKLWQEQMVKRGWDLEVDGAFGEESHRVLIAFQQEKDLEVDGVIGARSWNAAFEIPITE